MDAIDPGDRLSGFDRDAASLARKFHVFGRVEAPELESPMYAELAYGVSADPELLALAARTRIGQPPPNMLFAAAQYLLLRGAAHPLRRHYPALTGEPRPAVPAFPDFRDFCLQHAEAVAALLESRLTQTNVIQRSACLLPAFAAIARRTGQPLALIEIGPSAGLNMNWDRFRYTYVDADDSPVLHWGPADAAVTMTSTLRGPERPRLAGAIAAPWRVGVDLNPISVDDTDALSWLQALIWPEHVERHARLRAAIATARTHPPRLLRGDAAVTVPALLDEAPADTHVVVYATHALYQFPREARLRLLKSLAAHPARSGRTLHLLTMESTGASASELELHRYRADGRDRYRLATVNPHGRWLRWCAGAA